MSISEIERNMAVYLAHPFLDLPCATRSCTQHGLLPIYSFLRDNRVILRTMNYCQTQKPSLLLKTRFVKEVVQKHELFAQTYDFAFRLRQKIVEITKAITESGVDIIFIKAFNELPLDSHNFDILVKKQNIVYAKKILEKLGFKELVRLREPFKWFYRRVDDDLVISVHLHTKVAWEGVEFVDSDGLWDKYREIKIHDVKIGFPSSEHHLLITVAHAFFENQGLKLCDLMYIAEALQSGEEIDWGYIADWCVSDHWFKAFCTFLQLADHAYKSFYGKRLFEEKIYKILAKKGNIDSALAKKLIDQFDKGKNLPVKIPISAVAFAFISKVFKTSGKSFIEKIGKVSSSCRHYIRRRMPLRRELPTFLICFSGQDGTGKTTHAKCLQNELLKTVHVMNDELVEKDFRVKYVWSRGIGLTFEPLLRIIRLLLLGNKSPSMGEYVSKRERLLKMEPITNLWAHAILIDELLQLLIKVKIPLLFRQNVVCDRYIYDALIDVECDLGQNVSKVSEKIIRDLLPKPKTTFITDTGSTEIMRRKKSLEFEVVQCKRKKYLAYLHGERFILVDTKNSLQQNKKEILSRVLETMMT